MVLICQNTNSYFGIIGFLQHENSNKIEKKTKKDEMKILEENGVIYNIIYFGEESDVLQNAMKMNEEWKSAKEWSWRRAL